MSDPRVERTRAQLRRAAVELAATSPLHRITVAELTAAAGINRATFYAHHRSVSEVVCAALAADLDPLRDEEARLRRAGELASPEILHRSFEGVVAHVRRFEPIYRRALDEPADAAVWSSMTDHFAESIRRILGRQPRLPDGLDPRVAAAFGAAALAGALQEWLRHPELDVDTLIGTITRSLPQWWLDWE